MQNCAKKYSILQLREKMFRGWKNLGTFEERQESQCGCSTEDPDTGARPRGPEAMSQAGVQAWGPWEATEELSCLKTRDQCLRKPTRLVQRLCWVEVDMPGSGTGTVEGEYLRDTFHRAKAAVDTHPLMGLGRAHWKPLGRSRLPGGLENIHFHGKRPRYQHYPGRS